MADVPAARELQGKTAVVTGASSGIGRAIALEFASAGANVMVHARSNATGAKQVADEIISLACESRVALSDLAEKSNRKAFVQDAWDWRGGIDIWVNNAGADVLLVPEDPFELHTELLTAVENNEIPENRL
ncbi:MAG: SDR family NAD(P)-dependent oxidoreductase, partial [Planctomycetes bacterium]|nr:SDR family NAD(P)-dependent oxidoreductase [Planctomycetota bacterium]